MHTSYDFSLLKQQLAARDEEIARLNRESDERAQQIRDAVKPIGPLGMDAPISTLRTLAKWYIELYAKADAAQKRIETMEGALKKIDALIRERWIHAKPRGVVVAEIIAAALSRDVTGGVEKEKVCHVCRGSKVCPCVARGDSYGWHQCGTCNGTGFVRGIEKGEK